MLLRRLVEYSQRFVLPPAMYDRTRVRWFVDLDQEGGLIGFVPLQGESKRSDQGKELLAPQVVRSSTAVRPKLLADNGEYVLGIARHPDDPRRRPRALQAHREFKDLVRRCWEATREPSVGAVVRFLDVWQPEEGRGLLPDDFTPDDVLTFRVDGVLPIDLPAVQHFWARYTAGEESDDEERPVMTCLVCGQLKPVERRMPVKVKGIPGGQTAGMAIISANNPAFESYGLEASLVAPTCRECGEYFAKALNALIEQEDGRLYVGPLVYVFWTRDELGLSPGRLLGTPTGTSVDEVHSWLDDLLGRLRERFAARAQPGDVKAALRAAAEGRPARLDVVDQSAFYATALSASGGRVVVRDWIETTVERALANLRWWFHLQRFVDEGTGKEGRPYGISALAASLYREGENIEAQVPTVLVRAALHGTPLPDWLLFRAVRRNRAEQRVTRPRAVLIKMVLDSQGGVTLADGLVALDPEHPDTAYHCGRLLAVLENIQRKAAPGANTTMTDRFYGSASTAPASVFGVLIRNAQAHLAKIRKEHRGRFEALQRELEDILVQIAPDGFPQTLDLRRQGLFAIGYYHQRAALRAARVLRSQVASEHPKDGGVEDDA